MTQFHLRANSLQSGGAVQKPLHVEQSVWQSAQYRGCHYATFAPLHYEPNYAYPLIIWLHGPRNDERQLLQLMPFVSMRNYVSIAPRGPHYAYEEGAYEEGLSCQGLACDADVSVVETAIFNCLEVAKARFHIASDRVFLAGYNSGGTMAFRIGLRYPHRFAGLVSLGGPFPSSHAPLARLNEARTLPLLLSCGCYSTLYPTEKACDHVRLLHAAGLKDATLRHYECGDELVSAMLHDMNIWIMDRITGVISDDVQNLTSYPSDRN